MAIGIPDYTAGDTLGASDTDGIVRQTIMTFDDATDRDTAMAAVSGMPEEGSIAQTLDDGRLWRYDGSDWAVLLEPPQAWSPIISQGATVGATVDWGWYQRTFGGFQAHCKISVTGSEAVVNTAIVVSTPFTVVNFHGGFNFWDDSIGWDRAGACKQVSNVEIGLRIDQGTDWFGVHTNDILAADDEIELHIVGNY